MFESMIERPCSCCGKMTRNQEFVMIHAGKSRPALVAKCSSECGRDIGQYESQELSPLLEVIAQKVLVKPSSMSP